MQSVETGLRLLVIGQDILIAAIFLFGRGSRGVRSTGALLMLSIVGYLMASDDVLRDAVGVLSPLLALPAMTVPYFLWLFARAVFEAPWPRPIFVGVPVAIVVAVWAMSLCS
jgi:hypothetical protein